MRGYSFSSMFFISVIKMHTNCDFNRISKYSVNFSSWRWDSRRWFSRSTVQSCWHSWYNCENEVV